MPLEENLFPALVGTSGLLVGVGLALLILPAWTPRPVASVVRSFPEPWVLPAVLLVVGGALGLVLSLRALQ